MLIIMTGRQVIYFQSIYNYANYSPGAPRPAGTFVPPRAPPMQGFAPPPAQYGAPPGGMNRYG
jgi:hypothetical protein